MAAYADQSNINSNNNSSGDKTTTMSTTPNAAAAEKQKMEKEPQPEVIISAAGFKAAEAGEIPDDGLMTSAGAVVVVVEPSALSDAEKAKEAEAVVDQEQEGEVDPWAVSEFYIPVKAWSELTTCEKVKRVLWEWIGKLLVVIGCLYLFICSIDLLSSAFRLLAGKAAGNLFQESELMKNPIVGLMIGVVVTVLVQSSSTSTSIVITMIAEGILPASLGVYVLMGANVGTTVTSYLVSLTQSGDRDCFRRAFAASNIHDMFNWLTVLLLLPIEIGTGYLFKMTEAIVKSMNLQTNTAAGGDILKAITKPLTKLIVQIESAVITEVAKGDRGDPTLQGMPVLRRYCSFNESSFLEPWNATVNGTNRETSWFEPQERCECLFSQLPDSWSDQVAGALVLVLALVVMCTCLMVMVKTLSSMLQGRMAVVIKKVVNANLPGCFSWLTGYIAILLGAGITVLVQSSSIFTSSLNPLAGLGVITLKRIYPLCLGSNLGTTSTGLLAALAQSGDKLAVAFQMSLVHFFFNITGIIVWYPIPFMRKVPLTIAKKMGNTIAKYRWFAIVYIITAFLLFPVVVFLLSLPGWWLLAAVGIPFLVIVITVIIINIIQNKRPQCLPRKLRTWDWLPKPLHSLQPWDHLITKCLVFCKCCKCCTCCNELTSAQQEALAQLRADDEDLAEVVLPYAPLDNPPTVYTIPDSTNIVAAAPESGVVYAYSNSCYQADDILNYDKYDHTTKL